MVFIPRDPVMQNQFLVHDSSLGTTATAGAVVALSGDELVTVVTGTNRLPYGFLMQNVKAESSAHPTGFKLPGDLGSTDAFTGDPVAVAHLGLYDTTHYNTATTYTAGTRLGVLSTGGISATGRVTPITVNALDIGTGLTLDGLVNTVAICQNTLSAADVAAGKKLRIKLLI